MTTNQADDLWSDFDSDSPAKSTATTTPPGDGECDKSGDTSGSGGMAAVLPPANPPAGSQILDQTGLQSADIVDPLTGEIVDREDNDALIDCLDRIRQVQDRLKTCEMLVRARLVAVTEGDAKTRRVAGKRRKVVIEMPNDSWDQSILKEAFHSYPKFRDDYLRIESIAPKLREFHKLINTAGPDDLMAFRDMVSRANRGKTGTPSVKIEV